MMVSDIIKQTEGKMKHTVSAFRDDLASIRTGHATPALIEHIKVEYAGVPTPLNQMASISAPEARLLVIQPWDKTIVNGICKAIMKSELGLNPNSDGNLIRIAIPPLSEERRQELIKVVRKRVEDRRVIVRGLRHEAMNELKALEKNKEISQDEQKRTLDQLQKLTDGIISDVEQVGREKEAELLEV
jgi:ribosome recycling factor